MRQTRKPLAAFLVQGTAYSLVSLVVVRLISVVGSILVARILGREHLGMLAIVTNTSSIALLLATFGIPTALTKLAAEAAKETVQPPSDSAKGRELAQVPGQASSSTQVSHSLGGITGTGFMLSLGLSLFVAILLFFLAPWGARVGYREMALARLFQIAAISLPISAVGVTFGQALLQALRQVKWISLVNMIQGTLGLPITVGLCLMLGVKGAVAAQIPIALLGAILVVIGLVRTQALSPRPFFDRDYVPVLMHIALPAFLSGLVMIPALWLVTSHLSVARGFGEVGLFNICYGLFGLVQFLPAAVGMPLVPIIARSQATEPERVRHLVQTALELTILVTFAISAATCLFARPLIQLLYGSQFVAAWRPMILMSAAVFLTSISYTIGHYFAGTGRMWVGMGFNLLWFVSLVPIAFVLTQRSGAQGLALAFVIAYALMTMGILVYGQRVIGISVGYPTILALLLGLVSGLGYHWQFEWPMLQDRGLGSLVRLPASILVLVLVIVIAYRIMKAKPEFRQVLGLLSSKR
ncbi:MAG: oligosaccharide flippase family protein [candidate division WOR-3 bacterium]